MTQATGVPDTVRAPVPATLRARLRHTSSAVRAARTWWHARLDGVAPVSVLGDLSGPAQAGVPRRRAVPVALPGETARRLADLVGGSFGRLLALLVATTGLVAARSAGREDLLVGTPRIGPASRLLPIWLPPRDGEALGDLAARAARALREAAAVAAGSDGAPEVLGPGDRWAPCVCVEPAQRRPAHVDLVCVGRFRGERIELEIDVDPGRVSEELAARFAAGVATVCEQAGRAEPVRVRDALGPDARADWNDTATDVELGRCLHELVADQARRTPDAVAVVAGRRRLTYAELDRWSNRLANRLRAEGLNPGRPVGVWLDRDLELPVALLGVLKAGGAFVPLDPDLPPARARRLLADAGAAACLVGEWPGVDVDDLGTRAVAVRLDALRTWPSAPPDVAVNPADLVSIYYTSGSTGAPKGVANPHLGWVNRMWWMQDRYRLAEGEAVLHKTVLSFDDSAVELFWPLLVGGRVVLLEPGLHRDPRAILRAVLDHDIVLVQFVPSMLGPFLDELGGDAPHRLRHVISSGEALRPELVGRFYKLLGPAGCQLHNQWGPTEASIDATAHRCHPADAARTAVPIGRPIANSQVHVLDPELRPTPAGVEGELYVGGIGLARCYWGDPARTAAAFLPDPFRAGGRLYRTGDRGVRLPDGSLMFRGRTDHQVKIRGVRVELGEVERTLTALADVAEAVVTTWEPNPGDRRLVGYVVPAAGAELEPGRLRELLAAQLPSYSVPAHLIVLAELPLTASGKVDRRRLPPPRSDTNGSRLDAATLSGTQRLVAAAWAEFLDVGGLDDNFFALGGHSLLAARIVARLRADLGTDLPLALLFEHPTIAGLAAAIERHTEDPD